MSLKVNDVNKSLSRNDIGNVTLTAKGGLAEFDFAFFNLTNAPIMLSSQQQGVTLIFISNKNTTMFRVNVNPMSKKLYFTRLIDYFYVPIKSWMGEKQSIISQLRKRNLILRVGI